ncbi:TetR/AcrR family transcriptional regulator C-terminal domain-containing protein [Streptomyces sp. NPDC008121]|uniref:TetR/AcrR family transcriptional regulator C-terminal domain-containing protein n=1 Tax=Streptomyces sp. NPDC008121 TaxID=3364809 RepID=UPI0036EF0945
MTSTTAPAEGLLRIDDALLAANHFCGLLLWIAVNKAMPSISSAVCRTYGSRLARSGTRHPCLPRPHRSGLPSPDAAALDCYRRHRQSRPLAESGRG